MTTDEGIGVVDGNGVDSPLLEDVVVEDEVIVVAPAPLSVVDIVLVADRDLVVEGL